MKYRERLVNEYIELEKALLSADGVVLYGRTVLTSMVVSALEQLGYASLPTCVFDQGRKIQGDLLKEHERIVVISCSMRKTVTDSIKSDAEFLFPHASFFDVYAIYFKWVTSVKRRDCDYDILAESIHYARQGEVIYNIDCINTTFCNLNCLECSNGMQIRKDKTHISIAQQTRSLSSITKCMPICNCNMQGGEPLLFPDIERNILELSKNPKLIFLTIATNGTLLPSDACMQAMNMAGMIIRISDYKQLSIKRDELITLAKNFSVPCDLYGRAEEWACYGNFVSHNRKMEENRMISHKCFFGTHDLMLYKNKLFCCCRTLFAEASGINNAAVTDNCVCLEDEKDIEKLNDIDNM